MNVSVEHSKNIISTEFNIKSLWDAQNISSNFLWLYYGEWKKVYLILHLKGILLSNNMYDDEFNL